MPAKPRTKPEQNEQPEPPAAPLGHSLTPFKAIIQVIGAHRDEKGEIVREVALDPFPAYRPDWDRLRETIETSWPDVEAQYFSPQQNGAE